MAAHAGKGRRKCCAANDSGAAGGAGSPGGCSPGGGGESKSCTGGESKPCTGAAFRFRVPGCGGGAFRRYGTKDIVCAIKTADITTIGDAAYLHEGDLMLLIELGPPIKELKAKIHETWRRL